MLDDMEHCVSSCRIILHFMWVMGCMSAPCICLNVPLDVSLHFIQASKSIFGTFGTLGTDSPISSWVTR